MRAMTALPPLSAAVPSGDAVTDADLALTPTYLLLFDADRAGMPWRETAAAIGIDPDAPGARETWQGYLNRAKWMADIGFRQLQPGTDKP